VRGAPLPRSVANLKREISEKKWAEARQWAGGRTSKKKYRMPNSQRPDGAVANSSKRIATRFYQLKTGHCLTGQYLNWTKNRPTPQCWWCRYRTQTRDHLLRECLEWKPQQKILWAEVKKETGKGKDWWKVRDLLADGRCSQAVRDFLSTTDVGRRVPGVEEENAVSTVSELEEREWLEEQGAGAEEQDAGGGNYRCSYPRPTSWRRQVRSRGTGCAFPLFLPFVISLGASTLYWDRPGRRAKGVLATSRHCADCGQEADCTYSRHDLHRSHASNE